MRKSRRHIKRGFVAYALPLGAALSFAAAVTLGVNMMLGSTQTSRALHSTLPISRIAIESEGVAMHLKGNAMRLHSGMYVELRDGEGLSTDEENRLSFSLTNGDLLRMDTQTRIEAANGDAYEIALKQGSLWVQEQRHGRAPSKTEVQAPFCRFTVTEDLRASVEVTPTSTSISVFDGVLTCALELGGEPFGTETIAAGKTIVLSTALLTATMEDASRSLVGRTSDEVLASRWVAWNAELDGKDVQGEEHLADVVFASGKELLAEVEEREEAAKLPMPEVLTPSVVEESAVKLEGIVAPEVVAVEVDGYRLQKFVPGSGEWFYHLNVAHGNMKEGLNTYEVVAFGEDGEASEPLIVEIEYVK